MSTSSAYPSSTSSSSSPSSVSSKTKSGITYIMAPCWTKSTRLLRFTALHQVVQHSHMCKQTSLQSCKRRILIHSIAQFTLSCTHTHTHNTHVQRYVYTIVLIKSTCSQLYLAQVPAYSQVCSKKYKCSPCSELHGVTECTCAGLSTTAVSTMHN